MCRMRVSYPVVLYPCTNMCIHQIALILAGPVYTAGRRALIVRAPASDGLTFEQGRLIELMCCALINWHADYRIQLLRLFGRWEQP